MIMVVGSGPAGLCCAIEVARRGHQVEIVERRPAPTRRTEALVANPRAKLTNVRTMEHFYRWGIAENVRDSSPMGRDFPMDVTFVTSINGHELHRFRNPFGALDYVERSPVRALQIAQPVLEAVLSDYASSLPNITIQNGVRLESFTQTDSDVKVDLVSVDGASVESRNVDYLIGADGSKSTVRDILGIEMQGRGGISNSINIIFRAPTCAGD